ncbi:hypothetical protein A3C18_01775 [Candidatus Kaiserbacteria bacterium RIFCSPHIGHO2_02_FULL_54_11b]|uniref:Fibronectin type-III domain-containing protein n=2 Tax=Candidatus Kaiseribacteriota TaxID=1752734 RepID=A0A1F6CSG9_9BACT|nr:MAG: hypothetical protein A2704_00260 [Candidatus Kaiserbacteria bacterium RIFCSPHIGHO2_01_FULL_54_36b]OGG64980.1 MAG: hypothetical protein A3C18_01775 [Candidatus Kaiserbacteria bacterium RIFCSPHIGHO2_02_FULL_54_11b]
MNTNTVLVGGLVVLLAMAGLIFYGIQNMAPSDGSPTATTTDPGTGTNPPPSPETSAPIAVTSSTVAPSDTTAVMNGTVRANGALTTYWYEYGTTSTMGNKTSTQNIGFGYSAIPAPGYITGLVKETTYYFRLVAENQHGRVSGTQYTFRTTLGNPPPVGSAPTTRTLAATSVARTTVNLNGEVTPNKAATQYWFEYGQSANLGNTTALQSAGSGSAKVSVPLSLSGLTPATTYHFRLNAQNQFGTVNGAILTFKTANPAAAATPSITTRSTTAISTSTAKVRGTVDPNGAETTYWIEYSTSSVLNLPLLKTTPRKSAGAGTSAIAIEEDLSALSPNTTYHFRIVAQNSAGTVRGDRDTFKTK